METEEIMEEDFEEASDEAETDYQYFNDPSSVQPSSGPPSTPNSCASSPPVNNEDPISPHRNVYSNILNQSGSTLVFNSGKPCAPKRGPGRPRKEYIPGIRSLKDGRILVKKYRGGITKLTSRKRIVGKDERGVLQGTSGDRGLYLNLLGSPTDLAANNMDPSSADANERSLQHFEDMPYFPEKWPGKVCAFCNLGERSQLGQGEMLRLQINELEQHFYSDFTGEDKGSSIGDVSPSSVTFPQFSNRRQKGLSKCKNPVITSEYVDELEKIGYFESTEFSSIQDGNYYYVHRLCATWSFGVLREPSGALDKTSSVVSQSLRRKCSFCNRFGASVVCKMSCPKFFHFPCVPASGGFQIIQNFVTFCKEHVHQVPLVCTEDFNCRTCSGLGDVGNLVMCSICGDHYHGTCIGLPTIPGVRSGWQCKSCQRCQICRVPDVHEGRILSCEQCHKVYHLHCLRPVMSSVPKIGWKCRRCRVCSDCGSRTPGAGASSRWHAHYTVCDSCYQQRNKGFSCPICHRAYRAAAYREMVKCSWCNKVVHSTCDPEADLAVYHSRKENNPDYDYVCPPCKTLIQSGRVPQSLVRRSSHLEDDGSMISSQDGSTDQGEGEIFEKSSDYGLGKGKPYLGVKIGKKLSNLPFGQLVRNKGKLTFQKRTRISEFGRKRGTKTKMRGIFGVPGLGLQRPTPDPSSTRTEDEPGVENRLVLCSAKDKFILTQDVCVMCGAVGTDQEGCLISCTQCGQCYHPYCVNVKVTKIILKKGWRCLDCTTCEGCGEKNDEARLILCDECDISFHIYCMDPPLDFVPQGNWKCKWCAVCQKCGSNNPGKNSTWKNSYSECGPCASQVSCSVCLEVYIDGELIIQCTACSRWLHGKCDAIKNEEEAEKCDDSGYTCILCRPKDVPPPHLIPQKKVPQISYSSNGNLNSVHDEQMDISVSQSLEGSHYVDGVCLSEHGLNLIKSLQMEYVRKKRKKLTPDLVNNKDAAILAAIESVVAGSSGIDAIEDIKVEPLDPKEEAEIYKDGMVWERSDASPPEGFTLGTNEQGVVVLRKKRQRNLQKLGIGGFNVRNRTVKKDWFIKDDVEDHGENSLLLPPNENEKRKKPMRKRQKNKLTETYPVYLQEAFFGKSLLDTNKSFLESESSEDEAKSSVSDDKIIKLSPEELKILDEMKTEQKMQFDAPKENKEINFQKIPCDIKTSNDSVEIMKDIITPDLLEPELVDSIMKEENVLNENSNSLDVARDLDKKDSLNDIIPSNFNLDSIEINSKDVEDIFQGVIESDTKQSILTKAEPVILNSSTPTTPKDHGIRFITQDSKVVARFLPTQDFTASNDKVLETQPSLPCNINQNFMGLTDKSVGPNTPTNFNANSVPGAWSGITSNATKVNDVQPNVTVDENFVPATTPQSNCSQKSSERMRRDEDLGEMATISAVLYANTNHPELKIDYPNWTDRCKQIYKRWRALSNEKKAPFLQQARDNRSALRMKKVQQDQEKITSQQKALKEQEQERQWKQLQAMRAKEQQLQQFAAQAPGTPHPQFAPENSQNNIYGPQVTYHNTSSSNSCPATLPPNLPTNPNMIKQENKQLRDLLQRQESTDITRRVLNSPSLNKQPTPQESWNMNEANMTNPNNTLNTTTFREPFPVSPLNKSNKTSGNACGPRTSLNLVQLTNKNVNVRQVSANKANLEVEKKTKRVKEQMPAAPTLSVDDIHKNEVKKAVQNKFKVKEEIKSEIPESVGNELDKLEPEESVGITEVEGVGDILGGLGEDDDDELLNSLTAEMGVDFNILEYADPELDALTDCNNANLLDKLDFDEADPEERSRKITMESNSLIKTEPVHTKELISDQQLAVNNPSIDMQIKNKRIEDKFRKELSVLGQPEQKNFTITQPPYPTGRIPNMDTMTSLKVGDIPKASNYPRYNLISQNALCKISRGNLPPPPPPYPGPPPPYPSTIKNTRPNQEQPPLLLEDLLEQEKREQRQHLTSLVDNKPTQVSGAWRKNANELNQTTVPAEYTTKIRKQSLFQNSSVQPPPPLPPENIVTEHDRSMQLNYEQWLNNTNMVLTNQLKICEDEVLKLRKIRKSLNSKQRLMKKAGNELSPQDSMEFTKITGEQGVMQKHLENLRKQCRQHALLLQDYKTKHMAKLQMVANNISSPVQMTSVSPMVSPSNNSPSTLLMQTSPSPIGSHILQPTRSPLQSPSPLLSHSPVGISQSPVSQSNVSPYQNAQSSPRIGTPHSQIDENSFSPSANISSPSSMSGHHASQSPRITSPQQRGGAPQLSVRMATSPGHPFGSIANVQAQKFGAGPNVQDRGRGQLVGQQCLSQNMSPMEIQAPLASPIQMNTFGQSPDGIHANRNVMHYFQQKHSLQRQQSAPPGMTKNKPHGSSPKPNSTPPPSPHLHYSIQHQQQNMNRKTPSELMAESYVTQNDQHDQYAAQCRDNNMMTSANDISSFLRNNQDSLAGGGGGLSGMGGHFLPSSGTISKFGRFGRIKLGLFGGSPMWGLSNLKSRGNGGDGQSKHLEGDSSSSRSHLLDDTGSGNSALKSQGGNKLLSQTSHSQSSQASSDSMSKAGKLCEAGILKSDINVNSIVVIDDSPSEKQRIMDYDDFQDKGFVTTEVSLNSAAQNITDSDEMAVIESFASSQLADIVSSPLESEVAEEYVLFSSDVVDYGDSDDSMKGASISQKHHDIHMKEDNSVTSCLSSSSISRSNDQKLEDTLTNIKGIDVIQAQLPTSKSPEPKNFATAEDFEAMIDCRPSRKDEDKKRTEEINKITSELSNPMQINNNISSANILTCNRIPFTAVTCGVITGMSTQTTTSPSVMVTSKKIVSDVTQATAKVSIGNTTISVPLLKTMSLNSSHIIPSEKANKPGNVNLTKQPTILNVRGQKLNAGTIVSLSSLQIKPAANTKIVQATVVGKKLQLPQTSLDGVTNVKHNLIRSFNYPKLSSLTVLQDMSLPNKIFEDESASPENPQEQSDVEMTSHEIDTSSQSSKVTEENQPKSASEKTESPQARTEEQKDEKVNVSESEPAKLQPRQLSTIPQLSPLSKPAEMTSNMANVSQQLRSIMSSINSSVQIESKTVDQRSGIDNIISSSPSTTSTANSEQSESKKSEDALERMSSNQAVTITSTAPEESKSISVYLTTTPSPKKPESTFVELKKDIISSEKVHVSTATSTYSKMLPSATIITSISSDLSKSSTTPNHEEKKLTNTMFSPHLKRSKSTDDGIEREVPAQITGTKRYSLEVISGKPEASESTDRISAKSPTVIIKSKETVSNICKTPTPSSQHAKSDESQNVLLKQLLQNSSNSNSSSAPQIITGRKVPALRAPSLGVVSSLEAQLARPVIPPVPTNPPSILQSGQHSLPPSSETTIKDNADEVKKATQIISRETSFVSNPLHKTLQAISERIEKPMVMQNNNNESSVSSIEKKIAEEKRLSTDSSTNTTSSIQKDADDLGHKPVTYVDEMKSVSDATQSPKRPSSTAQPTSAEPLEETEGVKDDKSKALDPESINNELKKRRKREYQKNRRQMLNKEVLYSKKRSRKLSKLEEDYDNFIENLMVQLRQMPSLQVLEPLLSRNYGVCPPYGAGDFSKTGYAKDCHSFSGNLYGAYGNAFSANIVDFYNIKPFGYMDVPPEDSPATIQNGFYDQEFPPIKFDSEADQIYKLENMFKDRDIDTPESIVTSSSPECVVWDAALSFPGLKVIKDPDETSCFDRMSPVVPVIAPIPIKLQAGMDLSLDKSQMECCKENGLFGEWRRRINQQSLPVKDSNVTVTLTLTSSAAEDIMGVLRDLANILRIPPPTSYQIVERTTTPPSQKLGLYRTKGKDGKEGNPIDIQTILNGTAKFCRHCDVVILNTIIRAKSSEFPLLTASELINNTDDLYFCSKTCYKQFKWRPTNIIEDNMLSVSKGNSSFKPGAGKQGAWMEVKNEYFDRESGKLLRSAEDSSDRMEGGTFSSNSQSSKSEQNVKNEYSDKSGDAASRSMRYRYFSQNTFHSPSKHKRTSEKEVTEMLFKMNITVSPTSKTPDTRQCIFCGQVGDGVADGPSRLLNFDVDKWVHLNCALWSDGVYETVNGGLMNLEAALQASLYQSCTVCHHLGATIKCFKNRCSNIYHLSCAIKDQCVFYKNKTTHCQSHALKNEKENELTTLSVQRRVYVERDESRQVAAVMHHSELSNLLRVGSLTFLNIGQLLPHQLQAFHTPNYIYPIGYKIIRFYWSMRRPNKRCRYICSIADVGGRPEFRILVQEPSEEDMELRDTSPRAVWQRLLEPIATLRKNCDLVQLFPKYVTGEDLFGLTEPAVVRILESLPGIETLTDYRFKYGRNPLLELPLAINPSGAARTEPKQRQSIGWRKPHTQRSGSTNQRLPLTPTTSVAGEVACPYSKQFVHSKSSQYKKMKQEWRNNVYLARSKIQGLGLYAARDLEKHTMVIEYIGEVIRTEVSEIREKQYEARNRGIYMFRLDEDRVVDATLSGGLARYINHSCNPNCVTEIVEVDREYRIIIFAKRRINRGEELSYDYKFDIEDDAHKISCMCGAPNCRKWMN